MPSCTTDWELERKPGSGWTYNESGLSYNDSLFDTLNVYYNALGEVTTWTYEDPIDGCNVVTTTLIYENGDAAIFENGDIIVFN